MRVFGRDTKESRLDARLRELAGKEDWKGVLCGRWTDTTKTTSVGTGAIEMTWTSPSRSERRMMSRTPIEYQI